METSSFEFEDPWVVEDVRNFSIKLERLEGGSPVFEGHTGAGDPCLRIGGSGNLVVLFVRLTGR